MKDFMEKFLEAGEPADQEKRERQDFEIRIREQQALDHARLARLARPTASRVATVVEPANKELTKRVTDLELAIAGIPDQLVAALAGVQPMPVWHGRRARR